jgi:hypothetical protein
MLPSPSTRVAGDRQTWKYLSQLEKDEMRRDKVGQECRRCLILASPQRRLSVDQWALIGGHVDSSRGQPRRIDRGWTRINHATLCLIAIQSVGRINSFLLLHAEGGQGRGRSRFGVLAYVTRTE